MDDEADGRFREWANARAGRLHRTAFLLCGDWHAAEDLVQEAMARTALNWRRVEAAADPDAYVRKILVNECRSRWRRRSNRECPSDRLPDVRVDDGADARARRDELITALLALPPRQRATVVLRYFDGLTEAQTAQALGCSQGTVKSQTSRALTALRTHLTPRETPCEPTT